MPRYPLVRPKFFTSNSVLASGYQLFFYVAGTTTKQNTYTDATLATPNPNPVILNARGEPDNGGTPIDIFFLEGASYKVVLATDTDTDPPASPIWTVDNVTDANSSVEYVNSTTATRVNATTYTVTGDQTATFIVGQRIKLTGGADRYARVATSVFTTLTTLTVVDTKDAAGSTQSLHASMDTAYTHITTPNGIRGTVLAEGIADAAGTVDAITATYYPPLVLSDNVVVLVRAAGANTIAAPTFAPDSLTAKTIVKDNNIALVVGNIAGADHVLILQYNASNDNWTLLNPASIPSASIQATETSLGIAEIATQAETDAGTDDLRFVTPLKLETKPSDALSVGQGELKTASGSSLHNGNSWSLPGGAYGFMPQVGSSTSSSRWSNLWSTTQASGSSANVWLYKQGTATGAEVQLIGEGSGNDGGHAFQTYITASRPYDYGHGECGLFVYLMLDKSGNFRGVAMQDDPPWAYHGPTKICPHFFGKKGIGYRYKYDLPFEINDTRLKDEQLLLIANLLTNNDEIKTESYEITQAIKNADMDLCPSPIPRFRDPTHQAVLLDPMSEICHKLFAMNRVIEMPHVIGDLFRKGYIQVDNTPLTCLSPGHIITVKPKWKLTKP